MKITTKLNILGYALFATSWIVWFALDFPEKFWVSLPIQIGALFTFGICLAIGIYRDRTQAQNRPPQDDGEPRSE